ncbi:hypothetical protein KSP39_PZI003208 [Platanthera zijinensis]|uniref:Retrotransposon gag domain-containing protein n=1 Tax=Platanthera zijinensis TaxID=2320716 RepID=A0AAP0BUT3_9ASPA
MEEHQTEMLTLLRNLGAPPAPPLQPARVDPLPQPNQGGAQEVPPRHEMSEEYSETASSAHPIPRRTRADHQHEPANEARLPPPERFTREEIREVIAEEYRKVGARDVRALRPLCQGSPLIPQILEHPIPNGFKLPSIETFDGTDDPLEHVNHFTTIMRIYNAPDQLLCQVFPATLKGQARTWFHSLRASTIASFAELARQFVDQFIANRRIVRDPSHLSGIRQNEGESLKDFFRRFSAEARQIPGVDQELLRGVFLGGLRPGGFYSALMRETVASYPDLVYRVEAQITADEAIEAHRQQFDDNQKRKREKEPSPQHQEGRSRQEHQNEKHRRDHQRDQPPRDYTPLNTSMTNVFHAIQGNEALRRPRPLAKNTGDQTKYCEFHRGQGHDTEDCSKLKKEIEYLVKQGLLGRFLRG